MIYGSKAVFNLPFSKRDNPSVMNSINDWIINGPVMSSKVTEKGLWLTVKSKAYRKGIFSSDRMTFDCFIPKSVSVRKHFKDLHAKGKFEFQNNETYFVVNKIL